MKNSTFKLLHLLLILAAFLYSCESEPEEILCETCQEILSTESFEDQYSFVGEYDKGALLFFQSKLQPPWPFIDTNHISGLLCSSSVSDHLDTLETRIIQADGEIYECADQKNYINLTNYEVIDTCLPDIPMATENEELLGWWQISEMKDGGEVISPPCESGAIMVDFKLVNPESGLHTMYMVLTEGGRYVVHFTFQSASELILSEYQWTEPLPADGPGTWRGIEFLLSYSSLINQSIDKNSLVTYEITGNRLELSDQENGYVISLFKP